MPGRPSRDVVLGLLAILLAALIWGFNGAVSKLLYAPGAPVRFDAWALIAARSAWSFPPLLALAWLSRPKVLAPSTRELWLFAVIMITYGPGLTGLYAVAVANTSASHAALLFGLSPAVASVLGAMFLRERMDTRKGAAITLGIGGALILALGRSVEHSGALGDLLMVVWALSYGAHSLAARVLLRRYAPTFIAGAAGAGGTLILIVFSFFAGRLADAALPLTSDPRTIIEFYLEMVLGLSLVAVICQMYAVRVLSLALLSAVGLYGTTLVGAVAAVLMLGDRFTAVTAVAAVLLAASLGCSIWPARARAPLQAASSA